MPTICPWHTDKASQHVKIIMEMKKMEVLLNIGIFINGSIRRGKYLLEKKEHFFLQFIRDISKRQKKL